MMSDLVHTGNAAIQAGTSQTEGFGQSAIERRAETASAAVAAQAQAAVQARYVMAMQRPRDWDTVRVKLLRECQRPGFADVARYRKPVGKGVEGPSIRFAEAALRCMGNVQVESATIFDDTEKRIVRVTVTDLESNVTYPLDVTIEKTVERSRLKDGDEPIRVRTNSRGHKTYILPATEDDLLNKQNALVSKAIRTAALRILPGDILDECMDQVLETQRQRDAKDPSAARKRLVDAFAGVGVMPHDLKEYLGCDVSQVSPADMAALRALFAAIRDGETTWREALAHKTGKAQAAEAGKANGAAADLKSRVKKQAAEVIDAPNDPAPDTSREPGEEG